MYLGSVINQMETAVKKILRRSYIWTWKLYSERSCEEENWSFWNLMLENALWITFLARTINNRVLNQIKLEHSLEESCYIHWGSHDTHQIVWLLKRNRDSWDIPADDVRNKRWLPSYLSFKECEVERHLSCCFLSASSVVAASSF